MVSGWNPDGPSEPTGIPPNEGSSVIPFSKRRMSMADNDARPPVWYDVAVCHHYDGTIQTWVKAVGLDDPEDRKKIAIALRQAADGLEDVQNVQA